MPGNYTDPEYQKKYREANKEKHKAYMKEYCARMAIECPWKNKIKWWKQQGMITDENWMIIYQRYTDTTQCEECKVDFSELPVKHKHLDHCHKTGEIRRVLCIRCNRIQRELDKDPGARG